jgi:hypothetical protein
LDSRTNSLEIERVRVAIVASIELLSVEAIAVILLTPVRFGQLMFRLGPLLLRLRRLVIACDAALLGYAAAEKSLIGNLIDFRTTVTPFAANVAGLVAAPTTVWVKPRGLTTAAVAPSGLGQMATRLRLLSNTGQPLIRIERYQVGEQNRFIVYIPGTQNLNLSPTGNPFDMRSNLQLLAGQRSPSARATELALRRAGVGENDPVMLVGHSQGGLIALNLAERATSGQLPYRIEHAVTFGTPAGLHSAKGLPNVVSFENRSDLVPQLDLRKNPSEHNWATLEGEHGENLIDAHRMESYEQIIREIGASGENAESFRKLETFAVGRAEVSYFELGQR